MKFSITIFMIGFLSNELISPLFSPRIANIEIVPLYIQGDDPETPDETVKYYTIFDVDYEIELPFFPLINKFNLKLPGKSRTQNIDIIISRLEIHPYYFIDLKEHLLSKGSFLPYDTIGGILPIRIKSSSREIKKIHIHLPVREENDLHHNTLGISDQYWWTHTNIFPIKTTGNAVTESEMVFIGYGQDQNKNIFKFYDLIIKSLTNLEIKGLRIPITKNHTFCSDGIKLNKEFGRYISIDLNPREIKHILAYSKTSKKMEDSDILINFYYDYAEECYPAWLEYKEVVNMN